MFLPAGLSGRGETASQRELTRMDDVRLLHIADVHLGGSGPAFGARVREHQSRLQAAFARCIDVALFHRVHAVCIAGDLFDGPRPSERTLQAAVRELRRLGEATPPIPGFLLPGTHDCLGAHCVYRRPEFRGPNLLVFDHEGPQTLRTADGAVAVHGSPQTSGARGHQPLKGLQPDPAAGVNVALAHGSVVRPGLIEDDSALITREEIAASGMDYVALGHWHDYGDPSVGGVTAAYSGSPEVVLVDQKSTGQALLVTFPAVARAPVARPGGGGARVPAVQVIETGTLRCEALALDPETHPDEAAIAAAIEGRGDAELLLEVTVAGLAPEGFTCDVARLQAELAGRFFRLRIRDASVPPLTDLEHHLVSDQLISGRAAALFEERIAAARAAGDTEGERVAQRALQLALALLQGKEVLS